MLFWIIPLVVLVVSVLVIGAVLARKIPQLRMIDVSSIPTERSKQVKENIIRERVHRMGSEKLGVIAKAGGAAFSAASKAGRRAVQKLYQLEQHYVKLKQAPGASSRSLDKQTVQRLLDEAEQLVREEEFIPAEKRYIELISHNPKLVEAYEGLANLYLENKAYAQARETLAFTLHLSPEDASVHMSFADLERAEGNPKAALDHLRDAVRIREKNPKYLDAYIETALEVGAWEDAEKGIGRMKAVNPENQAIPEWEVRLKEK